MIMLEQLKEVMDDIEPVDSWAFNYIQDILIKKEQNPNMVLSTKQFKKLVELHEKFYLKY